MLEATGIDPAEMIAFYRIMEAQHSRDSRGIVRVHLSNRGDCIEKLTGLAGAPPRHPVKLFSLEEWKDLRSMCRHSVASSAPSSTDTLRSNISPQD
jgi:hypothetical protein